MKSALVLLPLLMLSACDDASPTEENPVEEASAAATATTPAPATAEEDIRHFLLQEYPDAAPMQYALAWSHLNGDGQDEAIVHVASSWFCGTGGCNTLVLTPAGPMWDKVAEISVSRTPITVLDTSTKGWKDITVAIGGGGRGPGIAKLSFDGEEYPANPTVAPAVPVDKGGTKLIAEDPAMVTLEAVAPSGG